MSGFFISRAGRRLCLYILFAALPVAIFAAAAQAGAPSVISTAGGAFNWFGTTIFVLAVIHTFLAAQFMKLAHKFEREHREQLLRSDAAEAAEAATVDHEVSFKAELFHFLGEIEVVFGLWILPLLAGMIYF